MSCCTDCNQATDDFRWPYIVHDGAFGPWETHCKSELLKPEFPICFNPNKPSNFTEIISILSNALLGVMNLCPDKKDEITADNDLLKQINFFLDMNWLKPYDDLSEPLKSGVYHHVYVIIKESLLRKTYVYFDQLPALRDSIKVVYDLTEKDGWTVTETRLRLIVNTIFSYGKNIALLSHQLSINIISGLDTSWLTDNNAEYVRRCNLSLTTANELNTLNLTLIETLKRYSQTPGVLLFNIKTNTCGSNTKYTLAYGNDIFNISNVKDFINVCKMVFAS